MGITRNNITYQTEEKDSFLWGLYSGTKGSSAHWIPASEEANVTEWSGFSSIFLGFDHEYIKTNPNTTFNRWRSYFSFYTSGWKNNGWAESAKIRLFVIDSRGSIEPDAQAIVADDFYIDVKTISGKNDRNRAFETDGNDDEPLYGFGETPTYQGSWGVVPNTQIDDDPLSRTISQYSYQLLVSQATGTKNNDSSGSPYRFSNGWIEIPIPLEFINEVGESHFKIGATEEFIGTIPTIGNGNQHHNGWLWVHSYENTNEPELVITYASTDLSVKELRNSDLTLQRLIQNRINEDITFSGLRVLDGYPGDTEFFEKSRSVSIEHNLSNVIPLEIGRTKGVGYRRFAIDLACDKRGELDDLTSIVYKSLYNKNIEMLDFSYGFINPKPCGSIYCEYLQILDFPPDLTDPDRNKYRNIIFADFTTLTSGI